MPVVCTQSMLRKAGKRGVGQREGVGRERACSAYLDKNKLPGEAVPEPGARWDGCASVLPREKPDTACIQRGDKHHFRGDRFDLPCIPLRGGGHRQFVQVCVGREASNAVLPTITVRPDRCDRDSLLQKLPPHSDPDQPCSERAGLGGSLCYLTSR